MRESLPPEVIGLVEKVVCTRHIHAQRQAGQHGQQPGVRQYGSHHEDDGAGGQTILQHEHGPRGADAYRPQDLLRPSLDSHVEAILVEGEMELSRQLCKIFNLSRFFFQKLEIS